MGRSKSKKRVKIVESIASAISSKKIFDVIDYRNRNERLYQAVYAPTTHQ